MNKPPDGEEQPSLAHGIVGVVGAGQMGRGIAQVALQAGHHVWLLDVDQARAEAGRQGVERDLRRRVQRGKLEAAHTDEWLHRLRVSDDLTMLATASVVIEAASEDVALKSALFARLDRAAERASILASNTSSIAIGRLAAATQRPERVVGIHFMNPAPAMPLVEIICALQTSVATHRRALAWAQQLGKTPITVQDRPGFVVNRLLLPLLNEACFALQEGLASAEDIDAAIHLGLNHPLGPLALADLIGLDTVLAIAELLHCELGEDKYRPAPLLRSYVLAGRLGRKSGRGFYDYEEQKP